MNRNTVFDCKLIELPQNHNTNGKITAINGGYEVPFEIKRVYYLYDIPCGEDRGGHAHLELQQLIVAASGSFDLILDDGMNKRVIHMNRPFLGVLMPSGIWRELTNFSSGSICLVMASQYYLEGDYIRDYNDFLDYRKNNGVKF
jgi:hypothetical protein